MKDSATPHFTPGLFEFLKDLEANNNREWFNRNKQRYLTLARDPMLKFIADLGLLLRGVSPHFVADPKPVGGSLFRIYRDIRFSKDKSPYKTNLAAYFPHSARRGGTAPGFYLSLQSGGAFGAAGVWHPDSAALTQIRQSIVRRPEEWQTLRKGISIEGDRLKRAPKGVDPDHPLIEDLKQKDFVSTVPFSEPQVCAPRFIFDYLEACSGLGPLVAFLCQALDVEF